jgi:precorrin-3B C17-methyltransferase
VDDPLGILDGRIPNAAPVGGSGGTPAARVRVDDRIAATPAGALILRPASLVAGIGCNRGTSAEEIRELVFETLQASGLARASLRRMASIDLKADEPGLTALAKELGLPLVFFGREEIGRLENDVPTPSDAVAQHVGVKSVCEATAILGSQGGTLIVPKRTSRNATVAIARVRDCAQARQIESSAAGREGLTQTGALRVEGATRRPVSDRQGANQLYIVGIGPGRLEHLTPRATEVLQSVECVAGYSLYLDLVHPLIADKRTLRSGMTKEVQRVEAAIEEAMSGKTCALVSSGDPGIYAMAGLVFETCKIKNIPVQPPGPAAAGAAEASTLTVEVIPGIPALCAGASLLGAPLTHDFAVVSLSDLLTPWAVIAGRLEAAARADFVIVLYNPKSKKRDWQLSKAQEILLAHRDAQTPVGVVTAAMRPNQEVQIIALRDLHQARVGMQTTVFVGSRSSSRYLDFMFTPRGYSGKYAI